jgi:hypothetical protein
MGRLRRLSFAEAGALAILTAWAFAPLGLMLLHTLRGGDVIAASDSPFPADQLQYLAWVRDAGDGILADNDFDLAPSDRVFLHPMFLVSGLLWKLGLGLQAAYLAWKPVAVLVLFAGFALFVRRTLDGTGARAAALVLALFYIPASADLLDALGVGSSTALVQLSELLGEAFPAGQLWGYLPTAIAVGAMPLYLLASERAVEVAASHRTRWLFAASALGVTAAWLHPWQGEVLVVVTLGLVAWARAAPPVRVLLVPAVATMLPLAYYLALSRLDGAWEVAQRQQEVGHAPAWVVLAAILPLLPLAAAGMSRPPVDLIDRAIALWPAAALLTYVVLSPSVPAHAFEGISLPLAVLSVRGWRALRLPAAAGAAAR